MSVCRRTARPPECLALARSSGQHGFHMAGWSTVDEFHDTDRFLRSIHRDTSCITGTRSRYDGPRHLNTCPSLDRSKRFVVFSEALQAENWSIISHWSTSDQLAWAMPPTGVSRLRVLCKLPAFFRLCQRRVRPSCYSIGIFIELGQFRNIIILERIACECVAKAVSVS